MRRPPGLSPRRFLSRLLPGSARDNPVYRTLALWYAETSLNRPEPLMPTDRRRSLLDLIARDGIKRCVPCDETGKPDPNGKSFLLTLGDPPRQTKRPKARA